MKKADLANLTEGESLFFGGKEIEVRVVLQLESET
jgi:hypothetical protein